MKIIITIIMLYNLVFACEKTDIKMQILQAIKEKKALTDKIKKLKSQLEKKEQEEIFVTHTELGYTKTGGNTRTETFTLDTEIKKQWHKNITQLHIDAKYSQDKNVETANKYLIELQNDYTITPNFAIDYLLGYKNDNFSTYNYQFYTGPGLVYQILKKDKHKLKIEGNILFSEDKTDIRTEYISYMIKGLYSWQILDNLKFKQTLSYRSEFNNPKNYFIYSKSSLITRLSELFSAGFSYKYDYVNILSDTSFHKDDTFAINLIVDY